MAQHQNDHELAGRIALVTGGSRGLGAATALALADAGADVALLARSRESLVEIARQVTDRGVRVTCVTADTSRWEETHAAISQVERSLGPVAILVNNAAAITASGHVVDLNPDAWAYDIAVNVNGPFYCTRVVLPGMVQRGWGRIINVSSGAGTRPMAGKPAYSVTKAALNLFTRALSDELTGTGVVPIAVIPGMIDTEMQAGLRADAMPENDYFRAAYAQGLLRPPEEPAALIRWLCGQAGEQYAGDVVSVTTAEVREKLSLPPMPKATIRRP